MSAPRIFPKGNDRTWTRDFYKAINWIARRMWHENKLDEQLEAAFLNAAMTGQGLYRIKIMGVES